MKISNFVAICPLRRTKKLSFFTSPRFRMTASACQKSPVRAFLTASAAERFEFFKTLLRPKSLKNQAFWRRIIVTRGGPFLAAARSRCGSDMPPACHSLPQRRFATPRAPLPLCCRRQMYSFLTVSGKPIPGTNVPGIGFLAVLFHPDQPCRRGSPCSRRRKDLPRI